MWKTILAVIGVVLAAVAVWLLMDMRQDRQTIEFINCKVENTQLTIQYGRCIETLNALRALQNPENPSEPGDDPGPGDMATDPGPALLYADSDPGGMVTDPDPGGMVTDPSKGELPWFSPTVDDLERCGFRNRAFRKSVMKCANRLELCAEEGECWNE